MLRGLSQLDLKTQLIILVRKKETEMNLSDARDSFYSNTGTVSELIRKISYSGLAIVWIMRTSSASNEDLTKWWVWILIGYVLALTFDLLQYFILGVIWQSYNDKKHGEGLSLDDEITPPKRINRIGFVFYYLKFSLVALTTICLLITLTRTILAEQDGAEQPATASESKSQDNKNTKPESEVRSQ